MKTTPDQRPVYRHQPIRDIAALCMALSITPAVLADIASRANRLYREANSIVKPDGSIRQTYDALPQLKKIQRLIKDRLLKQIKYPRYLTGSLQGVDYRVNASMHSGAKIVICEDIQSFFPSTTGDLVERVWTRTFGFSPDVAAILTRLTTMNNSLPQGAVTSSYIANLIFGEAEAHLNESLASEDIVYTRYVDDITVSSKFFLEKSKQTEIIARIYGLLSANGFRAKRSKHEVFSSGSRMVSTKLVVNKKTSLPSERRQNIRTAVFQIETRIMAGERNPGIIKELNRVTSQVGLMGSLHKNRAAPLKTRLKIIREMLSCEPIFSVGTNYNATANEHDGIGGVDGIPPW